MARASTYTHLPLDTYAKILGVHPAHFNSLAGGTVFPVKADCDPVWYQYNWQDADKVSREDLAFQIQNSEMDIESVLGYLLAPNWIAKEMHPYPRPSRRNYYGTGHNARGMHKSIKLNSGYFIQGGQRATTLVGTATTAGGTLVYSDPDEDGFNERATITLATTLTDACEIKSYFPSQGAAQEWEIRPVKSVTISGGNVVIVLDSWLLIDPDLWEAFPTSDDWTAIDPSTSGIFLTSIDVYREYNDFTIKSAEFSYEPKVHDLLGFICGTCGGSGCAACTHTTQDGCIHVRDTNIGIVVPKPASYDSDNAQWTVQDWAECREPDQVKVWYKAGYVSQKYLKGFTCDPLDQNLALAIAWMTTARLERNFCNCGNTLVLQDDLRKDLAILGEAGSFQVSPEDLSNPFGTRKGEIMAWRKVRDLMPMIGQVALA